MSVYETHPHIRNPKFSSFDQRWNSSKTKNLHQKHKINLLWCHSNKIWINYHWYGPDFSVPFIYVLIFWRAGRSENGPRTNTSGSDHRKYRYTMIKSDKNDQIRSKCKQKMKKLIKVQCKLVKSFIRNLD